MNTDGPNYRGYRYPGEIISHAVWLYCRFCLRFRDIEDLMAERGITVSYETIRRWCRKGTVKLSVSRGYQPLVSPSNLLNLSSSVSEFD